MPLAKCSGCGKFLSPPDAAKCNHCYLIYHRGCVGLPIKGSVASSWHCPECKKNVRRDNKAETPVRGTAILDGEQTSLPTIAAVSQPSALAFPVHSAQSPVLMTQSPTLGITQLNAATSLTTIEIVSAEDTAQQQLLKDFPEDVGSALRLIVGEIRTLRKEVLELRNELKSSNESCHSRMDGIETRLVALEKRNADLPVTANSTDEVIGKLKRDLNDRDQELMANDLVIANLPESQAENPTHLVKLIAAKLGVSVDERDIVSAERVGGRHIDATSSTKLTEPRPRAIMVRLARRDLRNAFLDGARVRRGATTEDLGFSGPARRFFINERLTKINQQLFRGARAAAALHGWRFVWTKRGRILARSKPGDPTCRIGSEDDIQHIIGPYVIGE